MWYAVDVTNVDGREQRLMDNEDKRCLIVYFWFGTGKLWYAISLIPLHLAKECVFIFSYSVTEREEGEERELNKKVAGRRKRMNK